MAKIKKDWIDEINNMDKELLGELSQEDLLAMNIGQLKMLKKEMEEESSKVDQEGKMLSGELDKEEEVEFTTMCGSDFDPKKSGSCYKQCSVDFPEAFASCVEHFKAKPVVVKSSAEKKAKAPSGAGKTIWNHVANSQAGKIDECMLSGFPMTLKEIADYAEGKEIRTMGHLKHLVFDWKVKILSDKRTTEEGLVEVVYFMADKLPDAKGEELVGKSAYKTV